MKILTWNINGIRASKVQLKQLFNSLDADIICLQETKVTRDMLDEPTAIVDGYNSYFSFSKKKSGYSGVATFCKDTCVPEKAAEGLTGQLPNGEGGIGCLGNQTNFTREELESLDEEGRAMITQHRIRLSDGSVGDMAVINVYCPRADPERKDRLEYKLRFFALLQTRAEALIEQGRFVVILGDINVSHTKIDRCDPDDDEDFYKSPGRVWLNQMLWKKGQDPKIEIIQDLDMFPAATPYIKGGMFVDTFRHLHPEKTGAYTCWCTLTSARQTNYGNRIDYILIDKNFVDKSLVDAHVLQEIEGSDHCPVKIEISCNNVNPVKVPPLCTRFMPEFLGKQQKLLNFFTKMKKEESIQPTPPQLKTDNSGTNSKKGNIIGMPATGTLKRSSSELAQSNPKKPKLNKSSSENKQSTLANFFNKNNPQTEINAKEAISKKTNTEKNHNENKLISKLSSDGTNKLTDMSEPTSGVSKQKSSVNAWKNLLGGLPPPPLCKGHKEPCVLRTVRKDGPNKGRQFYTCARAEGHSSNPAARCDFFQWLEKKKGS